MYQHNHQAISNLENAAQVSRTTGTPPICLDVANFIQELADEVRKADHELSPGELSAITLMHVQMLVPA